MIDVAVRVRPGDHNEELCFALRSIETNLPHRSVMVAGHKPFWLNARQLRSPSGTDRTVHEDALANLRAIVDCDDLTPSVAIFDDDMFVMGPLHRLPALHSGPLAGVIAARSDGSLRARALRDTADILTRLGIPQSACYDLHTPVTVNRHQLAETLDLIQSYTRGWDDDRSARILWKTIHFNYWTDHRASYSPDVKIRHLTTQPVWPSPLLSTVDLAFTYGAVGHHIRNQFPTPSRYEATA